MWVLNKSQTQISRSRQNFIEIAAVVHELSRHKLTNVVRIVELKPHLVRSNRNLIFRVRSSFALRHSFQPWFSWTKHSHGAVSIDFKVKCFQRESSIGGFSKPVYLRIKIKKINLQLRFSLVLLMLAWTASKWKFPWLDQLYNSIQFCYRITDWVQWVVLFIKLYRYYDMNCKYS